MIAAILQARSSSSRLPGKVMLPLAGSPMLARQIERVQRARRLDRLIVATSDGAEDDRVAEVAAAAGAGVFRGSLTDVLDRFYRAAAPTGADYVVRLTGDCPLADWEVIDACIAATVDGDYDYGSNTLKPTWPDGLDVEVMRMRALEVAWREGSGAVEREHVTPFLYRNPDRFRILSFENDVDRSALRWTVDEPRDYAFVSAVYDRLYPQKPDFTTADVLALLEDERGLAATNAGIARNEGLAKTEAEAGGT